MSVKESACVDEMLVGFRGECKFKMYIPSKPNKYENDVFHRCQKRLFIQCLCLLRKMSDPSQEMLRLVKPWMAHIEFN